MAVRSRRMEAPQMQLADYVAYHERLGKKVAWLDGIPFSEYRRRFLWSLPHFREYDVGRARLRSLLGLDVLGAIAMTTGASDRQAALCVSQAGYDLMGLQKQTRNRTRRGLENCEIREVGWDEMLARGLEINRAALSRQQRPSQLGDAEWWRRQCEASSEFPGVRAFGAYVGGELTAYAHVIVHSAASAEGRPVADIIHLMSGNEHLKSFPNEALIYSVTSGLLEAGCEYVVLGSGSDDERLLSWKRHMGYTMRSSSYQLVVNPLMHLVKPFVPKLRIWMDGSLLGAPTAAPVGHATVETT
jgi:hypothetical protein